MKRKEKKRELGFSLVPSNAINGVGRADELTDTEARSEASSIGVHIDVHESEGVRGIMVLIGPVDATICGVEDDRTNSIGGTGNPALTVTRKRHSHENCREMRCHNFPR